MVKKITGFKQIGVKGGQKIKGIYFGGEPVYEDAHKNRFFIIGNQIIPYERGCPCGIGKLRLFKKRKKLNK